VPDTKIGFKKMIKIFNRYGANTISKSGKMFAVVLFTVVISLASCSKEPTEFKLVPSDGTIVFYVRGYSIGNGGSEWVPYNVENGIFEPVKGVKISFENGKTFTSDVNGKVTVTLPSGNYLFRYEIPTPWRMCYNVSPNGSNWNYTLCDELKYNPDQWNSIHVGSAFTSFEIIRLYK